MNQSELADKVAQKTTLTQAAAAGAVKAVVQAILESLVAGEPVRVAGLGTFNVTARPARDGRNPQTGLPGLNGRQLAEEVSRRCPEIKVLFISGYARHAMVHNGVLDNGVEILSKPFTVNGLGRKVTQILQQA